MYHAFRRVAVCGVALAACDPSAELALSHSAAGLTDGDILGFESASAWRASHGNLSATHIRTQGSLAVELGGVSKNLTTLVSANIVSVAPSLAGIGEPGSYFLIDVMVSSDPRNTVNPGTLDAFVTCPSRGLAQAYVGRIEFQALPRGIYQSVKLVIPDLVAKALVGQSFNDLSFALKIATPGKKSVDLTYRFDHLRVRSPSTPPAPVPAPIKLHATLSYDPAASTPGSATFPTGLLQVPQSFRVWSGAAGDGTTELAIGLDSEVLATCVYDASAAGTSYDYSSCSNGAKPGDLLGANFAQLTIIGGDPSAGTTEIRAQLSLNPVGDLAGMGFIAPFPTYWGQTLAETNGIMTAFLEQVGETAPSDGTWISAPVLDLALRQGDPAPVDGMTSPPPANESPFDQSGHLNEGGDWDAYWRFNGNLKTGQETIDGKLHQKTQFDATLGVRAVLWGEDVPVASIKAIIQTDSGDIYMDGSAPPSASGQTLAFLFGQQVWSESASPATGFNFNLSESFGQDYPFTIWIFGITVGAKVTAGFATTGSLSFGGFSLTAKPQALVTAHVTGSVTILVASGGVDASIELIKLATPALASAFWSISTDPADCKGAIAFYLNGRAEVSSGGGKVDLVATFGACPFCYKESWNIYQWDSWLGDSWTLFDYPASAQVFPLPASLCQVGLSASIAAPTEGASVSAAVPTYLRGSAVRPATPGTPEQTVDCAHLTWTSSDASDLGFPATGCTPQVAFGAPGARVLTLSALNGAGESGSTTRNITVIATPDGPNPYIDTPAPETTVASCFGAMVPLSGDAVGGTAPVILTWSVTSGAGTSTIGNGTTATLNIPASGGEGIGTYTLTLSATDDDGVSASSSINVYQFCLL